MQDTRVDVATRAGCRDIISDQLEQVKAQLDVMTSRTSSPQLHELQGDVATSELKSRHEQ